MKKLLFTVKNIGNMELKNRIIMSAINIGFGSNGEITDKEFEFYKARAKGGAAAITCVNSIEGCTNMIGIESDERIKGITKLADMIHEFDSKLIIQLHHSINDNIETIGLNKIIGTFGEAALRCKKADADGVEINCGNGDFLSRFFSINTNHRNDQYGSNSDKRMNFPIEVLREVRRNVGENYPILLRISGAQMMDDGYDLESMIYFCKRACDEKLIDAVTVTGGWYRSDIPQFSYQVPKGAFAFLSDAVKRAIDIPVIFTGRITDGEIAEKVIQRGMCDFVGVARGFLADSNFANKIEVDKTFNICQGCNKCEEAMLTGKETYCAYNPEMGFEYIENTHRKIATAKKILVVGGGPAGLLGAKKAAQRGYKVTLCTDEDKLGGNMNLASLAPDKQDIKLFIDNLENEIRDLGVTIRYNIHVDGQFILDFEPYFVVVATGSVALVPEIKGINNEMVITAHKVFSGDSSIIEKVKKGKTVIIGGGAAGLEVAAFIAEKTFTDRKSLDFIKNFAGYDLTQIYTPADITIVEKSSCIGADLGDSKWIAMREQEELGVKPIVNTNVIEIGKDFVLAETEKGVIKLPADNVVLGLGEVSTEPNFLEELENAKISFAKIGDVDEIGGAPNALKSAYELFLRLYIA